MTNRIKLLFALLLVSVISARSIAQTYPFTLPANMTATVNVTTTTQEPFNNLLLGTNTHELAHSEGQALVRDFDPITIRFPHGLFANWYDWEQDKARVYGDETIRFRTSNGTYNTKEINFLSSIKIMDANNLRVGINELATLNTEKKAVNGEGFDMMWTLNMSADGTDFNNGSPVTVARYNDLISKGFQVKAMEMGNECFYPTQRSSIIPNSEEYIARAKSIYTALKALDPNIKLSVPLSRKGTPPNEGWNTELTQTTDYFDAVTVHTYVGSDPDDPSNSDNAYSTALTAREYLRRSVDDYSKVVAPDKPIWLTEWGVKSGGPNGVSALGMADCYMFLSENQDTYERANWFSVNGKLNSFLVWHTVNNKLVIKEPLEKTSYGSTFEIIRSVYENSTLLGSEMTVPKLDFGVNAVNARAVKKDGKTILFVVNLSNQEVPFTINMDGVQYTGGFEHKAMAFSSLEDEITLLYDADPLQLIKEGNGSIQLPKYSISTIVLDIKEILPLDFTNLATNDEIKKGSDLVVEAALNENFKEVSLWVNNTLVSTKTQAPYTWSAVPVLTDMMDPIYSLKLVGKLQNDQMVEKEITITTPSQWPYTNDFTPHTLPGKIEIEHYDYGGKGIAYFDKREQNPSFSYRGDDIVDFSSDGSKLIDLQSGEWLEYTVDVAHSGNYDFVVNHQTRRSPEFPAMSLSFPAEDKQLLTDLICTNTGSGVYATDTFKKIFLEKGQHILRLDILSYGFELDYFEFVLTSNTIDYNNIGTLNNPSNPLFYDTGDAIQHLEAPQDSIGFEFAGWFTDAAYTNIIAVPFVTATDDQNKTVYAKWTPKSLAGTVTIYGNIVEAQTLTVDTTLIENNSGKLIYQWQKATTGDFTDITGATDYTYTLKSADVGSKLRVLISSSLQLGELISTTTNTILNSGDQSYTITYNSNGGMNGTVISEIVGAGGFPTFIAQPSKEGYKVSQWINSKGDIVNAQSVINSDTTLFAVWEAKTKYKVRFKSGDSWVDVMTEGYPATVQNFPETPLQNDSIFDKWVTANGEIFDASKLVTNDIEILPSWKVKHFPLNVVTPNGTVVLSPQQDTYEIHSVVQLTVTPNTGYEFVNWTGDFTGNNSVLTVTIDKATNLTANFNMLPLYTLEASGENGTVIKMPNKISYITGSLVVLSATADAGYQFASWTGDYEGTENPVSLVMTENMQVTANFEPITIGLYLEPTVNFTVSPNPSQGAFTVQLGKNNAASYKLFTLSGMQLAEGDFTGETLVTIDDYKVGIYLLQVTTEQAVSTKKVILK